jgi:ABC-type branched-subunit amino acid transport system ATPase component
MALLELDAVIAGYVAEIDILDGVRLAVEAGSITGVIGPNGAGKSTLLKTIFGFLHPRRGRIAFEGRAIQALAPHAIKRLGIGYVPQGTNIFPQLTVHENLQLGAWVFRHDAPRVTRMLERAYATFPRLTERRRLRATALSGGEAKMLSVAAGGRAVGRAVAENLRTGLRPAPGGSGSGHDDPARRSEHRQGGGGLGLHVHARDGPGPS